VRNVCVFVWGDRLTPAYLTCVASVWQSVN